MIYHITTEAICTQAETTNEYVADSLVTEGFIHMCSREQLDGVRSRYYKNSTGLKVLLIDETKLSSPLKYELAPSVNEMFPHSYGPINASAVTAIKSLDEF